MKHQLDFEKAIAELQSKLAELKKHPETHSLGISFEEEIQQIEKKLAARVCKRMAVKAGQTLSPEEQRALLTDLETCESPRTCPHGRPTMIHLSVDMLERQFGRKGAR